MEVRLRGLTKRFASDPVLVDVDLDLGPGRIIAVIGLNGAGKTTLLRCLAGVIVPSSGAITWDGGDSLRDDLERHREVLFLPDDPLLLERQTVVEHLVLFLRAYGREALADDEVARVLGSFDLLPHAVTPLAQLSRGQRYKAALAALLLIRPQLWLLDEPFASGMDPQGMFAFKQEARRAAAAGACIVYTTQIIEIAERFCDELLVIERGHLRERLAGDALRALPPEGPGSLGERLAAFREVR